MDPYPSPSFALPPASKDMCHHWKTDTSSNFQLERMKQKKKKKRYGLSSSAVLRVGCIAWDMGHVTGLYRT